VREAHNARSDDRNIRGVGGHDKERLAYLKDAAQAATQRRVRDIKVTIREFPFFVA
jgi:hypothetical protein